VIGQEAFPSVLVFPLWLEADSAKRHPHSFRDSTPLGETESSPGHAL
jgi:hypothetical protein